MKRLTSRSSSEWKLITHRRPPGASRLTACGSAASSFLEFAVDVDADRLEGARRRMLARFARRHCAATMPASCRVVAIGVSARAATMARAMRRENFSSPSLKSTSAISRSPARASHCAALNPDSLSMRMSSGPSCMKLKPRLASSSCGDETPRSSSTPCSSPSQPAARTRSSSRPNDPRTRVRRGSAANRSRPAAMASGSRSMAQTRPAGPSCARMAAVCPPRPNVASQ